MPFTIFRPGFSCESVQELSSLRKGAAGMISAPYCMDTQDTPRHSEGSENEAADAGTRSLNESTDLSAAAEGTLPEERAHPDLC